MNIYIGNLSYSTIESDLKAEFVRYGEVESVAIIIDRTTGNSKGFGFVEMSNNDEGQKAIDGLNGEKLDGRELQVSIARSKQKSSR